MDTTVAHESHHPKPHGCLYYEQFRIQFKGLRFIKHSSKFLLFGLILYGQVPGHI